MKHMLIMFMALACAIIPLASYAEGNADVSSQNGKINGHEYVDLGLSVKWATCNVGTSFPLEYGNYYAWGEITTKSDYSESNCITYEKVMSNIGGNASYDAARASWGGTWRLPTVDEIDELVENCEWEWTTMNAHNGYKVTGPNGNSIFIPVTGTFNGASLDFIGENCLYWSSEPYEAPEIGTQLAYGLNIISYRATSINYQRTVDYRNVGYSIRPVSD